LSKIFEEVVMGIAHSKAGTGLSEVHLVVVYIISNTRVDMPYKKHEIPWITSLLSLPSFDL